MKWKYFDKNFEFLPDCQDHVWFGHIYFAYDLVRNTNPECLVELGTYYGTSISSFLQGVKDSKLNTRVYAVDSWEGDENAGFYGNYVYEHTSALVKKYYSSQNVELMKMLFNQAVTEFENESIDILHIDGLHTYDAVKEDYETWLPKMKKDGIILFHDTNVPEYGVRRLWDEITQNSNYGYFDFKHSFGLGVLFLDKTRFDDLIGNDSQKLVEYYQDLAAHSVSLSDLINTEVNRNLIQTELHATLNLYHKTKKMLDDADKSVHVLNKKIKKLEKENREMKKTLDRKSVRLLNKALKTAGRPL